MELDSIVIQKSWSMHIEHHDTNNPQFYHRRSWRPRTVMPYLAKDGRIRVSRRLLTSQVTVAEWRARETESKTPGNVNIGIRKTDNNLSYLEMSSLAKVVEDPGTVNSIVHDAKQ